MLRISLSALLAALLASGAALAQDFETLSPGNQKIAQALYDGQIEGTEGNLTLDDIAAMKQDGTGWGEIFHQMQADGQIPPDAKNLGQLVSGHYQPPSEPVVIGGEGEIAATAAKPAHGRSQIVVTTGGGQQIVVGHAHEAGGPKVVTGPGRSGEVTTAHGGGHGAGGKITVTTGAGNAVGAGHGVGNAKVEVVTGGGVTSHGGGQGVHITTGAGASAAGGGQALGHDTGGGGRALGHAR